MTAGSLRTCSGVPSAMTRPASERVDSIAEAHEKWHIVLDYQDGTIQLVADIPDERAEGFSLTLRYSGCGFVK